MTPSLLSDGFSLKFLEAWQFEKWMPSLFQTNPTFYLTCLLFIRDSFHPPLCFTCTFNLIHGCHHTPIQYTKLVKYNKSHLISRAGNFIGTVPAEISFFVLLKERMKTKFHTCLAAQYRNPKSWNDRNVAGSTAASCVNSSEGRDIAGVPDNKITRFAFCKIKRIKQLVCPATMILAAWIVLRKVNLDVNVKSSAEAGSTH